LDLVKKTQKNVQAVNDYPGFAPLRKYSLEQLAFPTIKRSDPVPCAKAGADLQLALREARLIGDYMPQVVKRYNSALRKVRAGYSESVDELVRRARVSKLSKHVNELDNVLKELHHGCWDIDVPEVDDVGFEWDAPLVGDLDPSLLNASANVFYKSFVAPLIDRRGDKAYRTFDEIASKNGMRISPKVMPLGSYQANSLVTILPPRKGGKTITIAITSNNKVTLFDVASAVAHTVVATVMDKGRFEWNQRAAVEMIESIKDVYERIRNMAPRTVGREVVEKVKSRNLGYTWFRRTTKGILKAVPDVDGMEFLGTVVLYQFATVLNTLNDIVNDRFERESVFLILRYMPPVGRLP